MEWTAREMPRLDRSYSFHFVGSGWIRHCATSYVNAVMGRLKSRSSSLLSCPILIFPWANSFVAFRHTNAESLTRGLRRLVDLVKQICIHFKHPDKQEEANPK